VSNWVNKKTVILFAVFFLAAFILGVLDMKLTSSQPVKQKIELKSAQYCKPGDAESACYTWTPERTRRAWRDGRIGPNYTVRVPESVEQAFRKAVNRRSAKFQRRVYNNMPWYQKRNWEFSCALSVGARAAMENEIFPRCMTPYQMKTRFERVHAVYVDCSGKALIGGGVGSMAKPRLRNSVVGVVGTGVGCMAEAGLDAATSRTKPFAESLAGGFKSLLVQKARELGY
jgi:hypothetical protein